MSAVRTEHRSSKVVLRVSLPAPLHPRTPAQFTPAPLHTLVPEGETPFSYLYRLCQAGARRRYQPVTHRPEPVEGPEMSRQLAHELEVIQHAGLVTFFLVLWDIVRYCREHDISCQGRGSAANSLVAYEVGGTPPGITAVDPLQHDLLFERFLAPESSTTPDIEGGVPPTTSPPPTAMT